MRGFSGIRLCKAAFVPILALALASMLAACGASTANGSANTSGATGPSATSGRCTFDFSADPMGMAGSGIIDGHMRYLFAFFNDSSSPCTLEGYPTVTVDNPAIRVTTTPSADTWSNIPVDPVTLAPNGFAWFAVQGRDETTNCIYVTPMITPPQQTKGTLSVSTLNICGGKLYVSPLVSSSQAFNQ